MNPLKSLLVQDGVDPAVADSIIAAGYTQRLLANTDPGTISAECKISIGAARAAKLAAGTPAPAATPPAATPPAPPPAPPVDEDARVLALFLDNPNVPLRLLAAVKLTGGHPVIALGSEDKPVLDVSVDCLRAKQAGARAWTDDRFRGHKLVTCRSLSRILIAYDPIDRRQMDYYEKPNGTGGVLKIVEDAEGND